MALGPTELLALTDAVLDTVSDFELEIVTHVVTGDHLYEEYVSDNEPLRRQIRTLMIQLDKDGSLPRFLAEIIKRKPGRHDLPELFVGIVPAVSTADPEGGPALDLQKRGKPDATATPLAAAAGLQRNVRPHLNMLKIRGWLEGLQAVEKRVCRVEIGRNGIGTGFLVGPSAVMTNWHVIRTLIAANDWSTVGCRFDFLALQDDSVQDGQRIPVGDKGLMAFSPASAAELTSTPDTLPPSTAELDYALLHLAEPAGTGRGWVELPGAAVELTAGTPLIIAQHPLAAPMKLAIDTDAVIGRVHDGLRLRYHTNTEAGSSGSPCFNMDWQLVALHHLGDPKEGLPAFNQGIPAELIRADIGGKGLSAHLAATG